MSKEQKYTPEKITREELLQLNPNYTSEDLRFFLERGKTQSNSHGIGIHKYNSLIEKKRQIENWNFLNTELTPKKLSELEESQILAYETERYVLDKEKRKQHDDYLAFIRSGQTKKVETTKGIEVNKKTLYRAFIKAFEYLEKKKFIENAESISNLSAVIHYFIEDESFFNSENLIKSIDGVNCDNSFQKGILIIGNNGNGKTAIMKCISFMIEHNYKIAMEHKWDTISQWKKIRFKAVETEELVLKYESLISPNDPMVEKEKANFINKYSSFNYCFGDLTKEADSVNYGKRNLLRSILKSRYDNRLVFDEEKRLIRVNKTFGTMNFDDNYPNDISKALFKIYNRYGSDVYDRIFEMFNIIEFKGVSFRK